jgi:hypothetical protein
VVSWAGMRYLFSPDRPIGSSSQDRFNRAGFARRIAQTLAQQDKDFSLVLGIYGPWGDGKTSVLRMMEDELNLHARIDVLWFNPWHFQTQEGLIRSLFESIGDAVGRKLGTPVEKLGSELRKYGKLLSLTRVPGLDKAVEAIGESLSSVDLEETKNRVDAILRESNRKLVVLIDDVDRLDESEVHLLFKLLKLSGNFGNVAYVVACDDEMVARALAGRYGGGDESAGREFLEKIVQVPLHLPPADPYDLRQMVAEGLEGICKASDIELSDEVGRFFWRSFEQGLEIRLKTPRQAVRYVNALAFALPLLGGQVYLADQLLIEGIRVFFPRVYEFVRDNKDLFLEDRSIAETLGSAWRDNEHLLNTSLQGESPAEKSAALLLLETLFPKVMSRPEAADRIRSRAAFDRYFNYVVLEQDLQGFQIERLSVMSPNEINNLISRACADGNVARLLGVIRSASDNIEPELALRLANSLAQTADSLPIVRGVGGQPSPMRDAASLVVKLTREQLDEVFPSVRSVPFGVFLLGSSGYEADSRYGKLVAGLIASAADTVPPYRSRGGVYGGQILPIWETGMPDDSKRHWIERRFSLHPDEIPEFLSVLWHWDWNWRNHDGERRSQISYTLPEFGSRELEEFAGRIRKYIPLAVIDRLLESPYFNTEQWKSQRPPLQYAVGCFRRAFGSGAITQSGQHSPKEPAE